MTTISGLRFRLSVFGGARQSVYIVETTPTQKEVLLAPVVKCFVVAFNTSVSGITNLHVALNNLVPRLSRLHVNIHTRNIRMENRSVHDASSEGMEENLCASRLPSTAT